LNPKQSLIRLKAESDDLKRSIREWVKSRTVASRQVKNFFGSNFCIFILFMAVAGDVKVNYII